jgi:hypothetical protein
VTEILAGIYEPDEKGRRPLEGLYGCLKMWEHLNRQGSRCSVHRGAARQLHVADFTYAPPDGISGLHAPQFRHTAAH